MQTVRVGNTSVQVSRLCFGTMQLGPLLRRLPLLQGAELLLYAFDCGITTFDTAKEYRTRDYLAVAFSDNDRVVIIDKSSARSYEGMEREIAESLIDFNRDENDLFLLNDVRSRQDFAMRQGAWRYLCEAKAMGLVKAIGLSTHTVEGALLAAELQEADFVQVAFNLIGAGILDGDLAAMEGALQRLKDAGKTVCAIKPLAGGMLSRDRWKEALEFVFTHPCVDCVCVGIAHPRRDRRCLRLRQRRTCRRSDRYDHRPNAPQVSHLGLVHGLRSLHPCLPDPSPLHEGRDGTGYP
jgi:aryl-alcohol dehydrogenase-like predicted oxidoreductase